MGPVGFKKWTAWVTKMMIANRQENKKSCPAAPFYLASLPCPLILLQPLFRRGIAVWWRTMLLLHKVTMQRQPVLPCILLSASRHQRPPICDTNQAAGYRPATVACHMCLHKGCLWSSDCSHGSYPGDFVSQAATLWYMQTTMLDSHPKLSERNRPC